MLPPSAACDEGRRKHVRADSALRLCGARTDTLREIMRNITPQ